jgi:hypothetical protein
MPGGTLACRQRPADFLYPKSRGRCAKLRHQAFKQAAEGKAAAVMPPLGPDFKEKNSDGKHVGIVLAARLYAYTAQAGSRLGGISMRLRAGLNLTALFAGGGIFAATLVGTASAQTMRVTDDWVTLRLPGGGFSILMPPDWRQDTPRTPNGKLSFIAKQPALSGRPGLTNCLVVVKATPDIADFTQADIDEAFKAPAPPEVVQGIVSTFRFPSIRENSLVRISNQPAWFTSYSGSYESLNAKVYIVAASVMLMRRGQTYSVNCTAADTTPQRGEAAWNAWQPILMLILGTFTIEEF